MTMLTAGGRIGALGRAELLLLWRNRTALFNALVPPLAIVPLAASASNGAGGRSSHALLVTTLLGVMILSVVYYTLVSTYVARREELMLKRLRVGELADVEILAGTAAPAVALAVGQAVLFVGIGAVAFDLPMPVNAPVLMLGMLGGVAVFALLAAASSAFTRTVEMTQVTTLPVVLACALGSGIVIPLQALPGAVAAILRFVPLTPVMELMRLGWLGTTGDGTPHDFVGVLGAAAAPAAILAAWMVFGALAVRRWFRWEPRR
jgi:ABC-2 type transport system permease protein